MSLAYFKSKPALYFGLVSFVILILCYFATPLVCFYLAIRFVELKFNLKRNWYFWLFATVMMGTAFFITSLYWILLANQSGFINYEILFYPEIVFWIIEIFHFLILVTFVICLIRVIRFPFSPYSALYASIYNGVHVLYGGCPVTELQNYLSLQTETITPIDNIFWRGIFGTDPEILNILRVVFGLFSLALVYLAYKQFMKIPVDKWTTAWAEKDFSSYNKKSLA